MSERRPQSENLQTFFQHWPAEDRLYVCIIDEQHRIFDFTDDTFKERDALAHVRDGCLPATGRDEPRAAHGCSHTVEIDLSRLLRGDDPNSIPADGAIVMINWMKQAGDEPKLVRNEQLGSGCDLRKVGGHFEPVDERSRRELDEQRAFEKRENEEKEYRAFSMRESEAYVERNDRAGAAVRTADVGGILRLLAEDICHWAGGLKRHVFHEISHSAKDPFYLRTHSVPEDAPFELLPMWAMRTWIGVPEVFDLLEFHKSAEFARSFSDRLKQLHDARVEFARSVVDYIVRTRGEDFEGMFVVDEARKGLKHRALSIAEYVDIIALQFEAANQVKIGAAVHPADASLGQLIETPPSHPASAEGGKLLLKFSADLHAYIRVVSQIIIEANHPEIQSFEEAMDWVSRRSAELRAAHAHVQCLVDPELIAAVVSSAGIGSRQSIVELTALMAECTDAVSYVFTSGPPRAASDDPRAVMAARVVAQKLETASKAVCELEARGRFISAAGAVPPPAGDGNQGAQHVPHAPDAKLEPRPFVGGEIIFYEDRVEICGVDVCSGPRCRSRRVVLEILSRRGNDRYLAFSGEDLEVEAKEHGAKGTAAGWIRDLRDDILEGLRTHANIISEHKDVILSGDSGYRFAETLTVRYADPPTITDTTDITDTAETDDVPDPDVPNVRDDEAAQRQEWILEQLQQGVELKASAVAAHFGRGIKTAYRDLAVLREAGKIEFVGDTRTGYYRLRKGK